MSAKAFTIFGVAVSLRFAALCALVVQTTSAVILTRYSRQFASGEEYYSTTMVVMSELVKLIISLALVHRECVTANPPLDFKQVLYDENLRHWPSTLKLAVPGLLYTVQNNLVYVALSNLEATTFQVGYQMKVITTAILSVIMLHRWLSGKKWTALILLTAGIVLTQVDSSHTPTGKHQNFFLGITSVITCGFCSAFAGVYFEKILKGTAPSVWMRNVQLAFFAFILGIATQIYVDGLFIQFFRGYNLITWSIIGVQAVGGLIVALVVKYADNILKGFATAISIILCGLTSAVLFNFHPSATFVIGALIVVAATMLYSLPEAEGHNIKALEKVESKSPDDVLQQKTSV